MASASVALEGQVLDRINRIFRMFWCNLCYLRFKMDPLTAGFWTRPIDEKLTPPSLPYPAFSKGYGVARGNWKGSIFWRKWVHFWPAVTSTFPEERLNGKSVLRKMKSSYPSNPLNPVWNKTKWWYREAICKFVPAKSTGMKCPGLTANVECAACWVIAGGSDWGQPRGTGCKHERLIYQESVLIW